MSHKTKTKGHNKRRQKRYEPMIIGIILVAVLLLVGIGLISRGNTEDNTEDSSRPSQARDAILCGNFSSFSGQYVEDGSDIPVENVAAVLVKNDSEDFLDLATLECEINGKKASFVVTGLPAGKSAWVLEKNKMTVDSEANFEYVDQTAAFKKDVVSKTDKITLSAEGNMLTAVNNTDEKLEGVFVYYKTVHSDGNYFGGITYMTTFGDLEPGEKQTKLAGHYEKDKTEIVRIGWKED